MDREHKRGRDEAMEFVAEWLEFEAA